MNGETQKQKQQQEKEAKTETATTKRNMNSLGGCPKKTVKAFFNNKQVYKLQGQTVQAMQAVGFQGHAGPIEIATEGNEALAASIGQYDEFRARAEVGELAKAVHQTLEVAESFLQSTQTSGEVPDNKDEEIVQKWCRSIGHRVRTLSPPEPKM